MNQGLTLLGGSFSNKNIKINLLENGNTGISNIIFYARQTNPFSHQKHHRYLHNQTRQKSFPSIENNKPLATLGSSLCHKSEYRSHLRE